MKFKIGTILLVFAFTLACSSDKDEDSNSKNTIVGSWDVVEFVVDPSTASDNAQFGRQIVRALANIDCYVVTLTFNEDLSAEAKNALATAAASATLGAGGLQVECPTEDDFDTVSNTYTFTNGVVSFVDEDGEIVEVPVIIKGDEMTVEAASLNLDDFNEPGQLIFNRR